MPILPKTNEVFRFPPKCPLDNVQFQQQRKLILADNEIKTKMGEGYDLLSAKKKLIKNTLQTKKEEVVIE